MRVLLGLLLALQCLPLQAEKADREKATQIEANRMTSDDTRRTTIFEGNVVLTKGTITVRADRIVVREDAQGYQHSTATGDPVRFRQRQDAQESAEPVWLEGEARRIVIDDSKSTVELFEQARVNRGGDEVAGDHIFVDQRSDFFSVNAGKKPGDEAGAASGRVRAVLQPKAPSNEPAGPPK